MAIKKQPKEAFEEDLPLSDKKIQDIQAEAATNVNRQMNENKDNPTDPEMETE